MTGNTKPMTAAYCDVDGTLTNTNIVGPLLWAKRCGPKPDPLWLATLPVRGPWWWCLDQFSRRASNEAIYSNYRGMAVADVCGLAEEYYRQEIKPRFFPQALEFLSALRSQGVRVVLVTGGLDLFMRPLAADLDADCLAPQLEAVDGYFTGRLTTPPLTGVEKAAALRQHASRAAVDLPNSYALGDALGDLAMLECVGRPIAVNPDRRLEKIALDHCWRIEKWKS